MRIELDLPDWVEERHIRIFAGIEEVARKLKGKSFEIKIIRCALCGKCCVGCEDLEERPGYKQPNGKWAMMCKRNEGRPFSCSANEGFPEDCSIRWKQVE